MQDAVNAVADRLDLRQIGQLGRLELLVGAEIGGRFQIAEKQVRIDRRQQFSQSGADPAGSAGHQYAWHFIPLFRSRGDEYDAAAAVRQAMARNTNTTVIPRESGVSSNRRRQCLLDHPPSRMMT